MTTTTKEQCIGRSFDTLEKALSEDDGERRRDLTAIAGSFRNLAEVIKHTYT